MPRRHRTEPKTSPRRLEALEKQRKALDLSLSGADYKQIALALGYHDPSGAYRAVMAGMRKVVQPGVDEIRRRNLERVNRMRLGLEGAQFKGNGEAIAIELKLQEREARYLGLDRQSSDTTAQAVALAQVQVVIQVDGKDVPLGEWRRAALALPEGNGDKPESESDGRRL